MGKPIFIETVYKMLNVYNCMNLSHWIVCGFRRRGGPSPTHKTRSQKMKKELILIFISIFLISSLAVAGGKDKQRSESSPPGWSKGKKTGWQGSDEPPGLSKKKTDSYEEEQKGLKKKKQKVKKQRETADDEAEVQKQGRQAEMEKEKSQQEAVLKQEKKKRESKFEEEKEAWKTKSKKKGG
jgi:hypothetical protein